MFPHQISVCNCLFPHTCHMPRQCAAVHYAVANWLMKLQNVTYSPYLEIQVFKDEDQVLSDFVVFHSTSRIFQDITSKQATTVPSKFLSN
jgi:hypothetical protein